MSLRELNRRLEKIEARAKTKQLGVLPIRTEIDLDAVEFWETLTPKERDYYRAKLGRSEAASMHSTEPLTAIVVTVTLPSEDELWRLDFEDAPETETVEPVDEPAPPTWEVLRDAYVASSRQIASQT